MVLGREPGVLDGVLPQLQMFPESGAQAAGGQGFFSHLPWSPPFLVNTGQVREVADYRDEGLARKTSTVPRLT